ncbi:MAG: phytoene/squalene synthase family protein [Saprospiraceae bacterium]|nr:phytoene/squalene synthase family protein [Saprospiraceae bacterium]
MKALYDKVCADCSKLITKRYSTSFSSGIRVFSKKFRKPIYNIYGFVRFADEIVDTFHDQPRATLLQEFRNETYKAIERRISLNPVLHAFQEVVHEYGIERELIDAFLDSMEMDLHFHKYEDQLYRQYIYGSAEVVGLMCLKVFVESDQERYEELKENAKALGSAFQKINFLRDMKSDFQERGRVYFPGVNFENFTNQEKEKIEEDIQVDFDKGFQGIVNLPEGARLGVYIAYKYYIKLHQKIKKATAAKVKEERIRVNDGKKMVVLFSSMVRSQLNIL